MKISEQTHTVAIVLTFGTIGWYILGLIETLRYNDLNYIYLSTAVGFCCALIIGVFIFRDWLRNHVNG